MQHAEDQSVSAVLAVDEASAASSTPGLQVEEAAATVAAAPPAAAAAVACEQPQNSQKGGGPATEAKAAEGGPLDIQFAAGAPSAAAGDTAASETTAAAGGKAAAEPSTEIRGDCDTTIQTDVAPAHTLDARSEVATPLICSEEAVDAAGTTEETESQLPSEAHQAIPIRMGRQTWRPRGQRLSFGRLCKGNAAPGGCAGNSSAAKKRWEHQQQQKQVAREAREAEKQARAVKEKIRLQRRKQREAKKQRKKENEMKSAKVQVIKNTTKIKKWRKQARRQLVKMSPEMIRNLYGVQI